MPAVSCVIGCAVFGSAFITSNTCPVWNRLFYTHAYSANGFQDFERKLKNILSSSPHITSKKSTSQYRKGARDKASNLTTQVFILADVVGLGLRI